MKNDVIWLPTVLTFCTKVKKFMAPVTADDIQYTVAGQRIITTIKIMSKSVEFVLRSICLVEKKFGL